VKRLRRAAARNVTRETPRTLFYGAAFGFTCFIFHDFVASTKSMQIWK
jgi:hypothetical protein